MTAPAAPPPARPSDTPGDRARPLVDHLTEIQRRLRWALASVAALSVAGWFLTAPVIHRLARSVGPMIYLAPTEAFAVRFKMAVLLGLFLSAPVLIYHLWRFVGVALTLSERRVVLGALPFSYLLFLLGASLGWFVIVPVGLKILTGFATADLRPTLSVAAVLEFALWTSGGLGLLFQLPVVIAALAAWGFVRAATLRRYRRHALIAILILSAVVTPGPDVFSQLALALPTYLLFEISIAVARAMEP